MTQKVLIRGPFGSGAPTGWTRSFPKGSVSGSRWMLDVVADLRAYAAHHDMGEAEEILAETEDRLSQVLAHG
ncbi:hypothetical protein [Pseudooceanicola sp. 200-1SW]|uniref:hypothetical protein n=1 Tax=Pseudooceanicola sp. 200-1SW TaxID=3425949 RepID=UPI003D7FFC83